MATTKASPFDHTSMDKRLYYNLKLPALSSAFTRMVRSYMIHANSVGDITDQEAMTAEAFTDLLDDPIAWDLATAAAPVLKSQSKDTNPPVLQFVQSLLQQRLQASLTPAMPLAEADQWEEDMLWRKMRSIVHYVAWAVDQLDTASDPKRQAEESETMLLLESIKLRGE